MKSYRIAKNRYAKDLTGTGSRKYGGRWNQKGTNMLYSSENISLAVLETLVHVDKTNLPDDLQLVTLTFPDSVSCLEISQNDLPHNWREYPASNTLAQIGSDWIDNAKSLLLKVPSVVIPEERNILINPNHLEFKKIRIDEIKDFEFDVRFST